MTEIERLRADIRGYQQDIFHLQGRVKQNHQLATEIERLRALSVNNAHSWDTIVRERDELRAEIERLLAALKRIDGINDNPAVYNPMIEEVLRRALEPKP